jgi:hypothetical protein
MDPVWAFEKVHLSSENENRCSFVGFQNFPNPSLQKCTELYRWFVTAAFKGYYVYFRLKENDLSGLINWLCHQ